MDRALMPSQTPGGFEYVFLNDEQERGLDSDEVLGALRSNWLLESGDL
jgi:hypothetical protein